MRDPVIQRRSRFPGASAVAALLLALWAFLNLAAAFPSLHQLWHDDHGCDDSVCAIATVAHGAVDSAPEPPIAPTCLSSVQEVRPPTFAFVLASTDCPPLPGRAPPFVG